jgi:hypothetical protein
MNHRDELFRNFLYSTFCIDRTVKQPSIEPSFKDEPLVYIFIKTIELVFYFILAYVLFAYILPYVWYVCKINFVDEKPHTYFEQLVLEQAHVKNNAQAFVKGDKYAEKVILEWESNHPGQKYWPDLYIAYTKEIQKEYNRIQTEQVQKEKRTGST